MFSAAAITLELPTREMVSAPSPSHHKTLPQRQSPESLCFGKGGHSLSQPSVTQQGCLPFPAPFTGQKQQAEQAAASAPSVLWEVLNITTVKLHLLQIWSPLCKLGYLYSQSCNLPENEISSVRPGLLFSNLNCCRSQKGRGGRDL